VEQGVNKTVLTVDDSKAVRDMVAFTLKQAGYDVKQASDGQNALDVLGADKVDCIVTDLNMPVMDGLELIKQLRQHPIHKRTPILMLTTEKDPSKKQAGREAGATGWIVKPFNSDKLINTIKKVVM
jgi:two-component system chemotaxis response regulator CheY